MTLTKIKPVVIIASAVAVLILVTLLFSVITTRQEKPKPSPSNTSKQKENKIALPQAKNFDNEINKIKSSLPLTGSNYSVKFSQSLNIILADIEATSAQQYLDTKKEIETIIKSKGVEDICSLNIFWTVKADPEIRKSVDAKDTITTGCPVVPPKN